MRRVALLLVLLLSTATAFAGDDGGHKKLGIALGVGGDVYFPSDSTIRKVFGSSIFSIGANVGGYDTLNSGRVGLGVGFVSANTSGSDFYLAQGLVTYEHLLGTPSPDVMPYAKVGVGVAYADYIVKTGASRFAAKRGLPAAAFEVGVVLAKRVRLKAVYDWFGACDGFNFSGLKLEATYTLLRY